MKPATRDETRARAIGSLLHELSDLLVSCYAVPEAEQPARWAADAEKITGCVALALHRSRQLGSGRAATDHRQPLR